MAARAQPSPSRASLWDQAWHKLEMEQPSLIEDYTAVAKSAGFGGPKPPFNEDIPAVVRNRVNAMRSKQWKFTIGRRSIRVRDQVEKLLAAINLFKDGAAAAANADPLHAGLPWAGICLLLLLLNNDTDQLTSVTSGLDFISTLVVYYRVVEKCLSNQILIEKELEKSVVILYALILEYQAKVARYMSRKTLSRFFRNLPKLDDRIGLQAKIHAADDRCKAFLIQQNASELRRDIGKLSAEIQKLNAEVSNDNRSYETKVIQIMEKVSSGMVENIHNTILKKLGTAYLNSGQWLWSNQIFGAWKLRESGCFWLNGGVGSGKTCLASIAIERLIKDGENIAFYYCINRTTSKGQRESSLRISGGSTPEEVLRSLLVQLCFRSAGASEQNPLIQSYEDDPVAFFSRLPAVDECEDGIVEMIEQGTTTYIVIDALDECSDATEMHIPVNDFFKDTFVVSMTGQNAQDIQDYASNELRSEDRLRRSPLKQNSILRDEVLTVLLNQAGGMFRWVEIQIELLCSKRLTSSIEESLRILRSNAGGTNTEILDQAYSELFEKNTNSEDGIRQIAIAALRWVLCAVVPLTPNVLASFVAQTDPKISHSDVNVAVILESTSNFLIVNETGVLQIAHVSVLRFIDSAESGPNISVNDAHRSACIACVNCLISQHLLDWQQLRRGWEIITRLRRIHGDALDLLPFQAYATTHHLLHLSHLETQDHKQEQVKNLLAELVSKDNSQKFSQWFDLWARFADSLDRGVLPRFHAVPLPDTLGLRKIGSDYPFLTRKQTFLSAFGVADVSLAELISTSNYLIKKRGGDKAIIFHGDQGRDLLCHSASDGLVNVARFLVEQQGVKVSVAFESGWTPLHSAAFNGKEAMTEFLVDAGASMSVSNSEKWTVLQAAVHGGNMPVVKLLVEKGATIDGTGQLGTTPLHLAVAQNHETITKFLVARGAKVDAIDSHEFTPLQVASCCGFTSLLQLLIETLPNPGASLNHVDYFQRTVLHQAVCTSNEDAIKLLIRYGADPTLLDGYGHSSLDWAFFSSGLFQLMGKWCDNYQPTSEDVRFQRLCEFIRIQCEKILIEPVPRAEKFYYLGHSLIRANNFTAALTAFRLGDHFLGSQPAHARRMFCAFCNQRIGDSGFFICSTCPLVFCCTGCRYKYNAKASNNKCRGHGFMRLGHPSYWTSEEEMRPPQSWWLQELMNYYSPKSLCLRANLEKLPYRLSEPVVVGSSEPSGAEID